MIHSFKFFYRAEQRKRKTGIRIFGISLLFLSFQAILKPNMSTQSLSILYKGELIGKTEENVLGIYRDSRIPLHIQSKAPHSIKTHNLQDFFILLLREFLGVFFPQKMSVVLSFFCTLFCFFPYSNNPSQLLPFLFHWTMSSEQFGFQMYFVSC